MTKPYTAADLAEKLGIDIETFYRRRETLHAKDALPQPVMSGRPYRWDRASIDAWFGRHHPHFQKLPAANDSAPIGLPVGDEEQRALLSEHYRRTRH